jgi:hypothetical protein
MLKLLPRPADPGECLVCQKPYDPEMLIPVYGDQLPGACAGCYTGGRERVLRAIAAWCAVLEGGRG